jgi:hypothetical protein
LVYVLAASHLEDSIMPNSNLRAAANGLAVAFATLAWGTGHATVLVFDQVLEADGVVISTISGRDVPPDYGDRVAAGVQAVPGGSYTYGNNGEGFTPNVVVDFEAVGAGIVSIWATEYGDLNNVAFGNQRSSSLRVQFNADAGHSAQLYGFDLAGFPNDDYTLAWVRVLGDGATLFEQGEVVVQGDFTGPRRTSFASGAVLSAQVLAIEIDYSNIAVGRRDNIGIDNIRFGQFPAAPVPELPSALLLALGLAAFPLWRRCR